MKKTYLYHYFQTYPNRVIARADLEEAFRYVPSESNLNEMISLGLASGWLNVSTKNGTAFYSLKQTEHE